MAKSHRSVLAGLIALPLAFGLFGAEARAQAPAAKPIDYPAACAEVRPETADEARKMFLLGKTKADEASYDEAVTLLVDAYRKDCSRHAFLQIIASVLEKQGRYEEVIVALTLVLERQAMTGADRAPIETKVKNLRAAVEERKKRDAAAAQSAPKGDPVPPPSGAVREHTIVPWIVTGVGGAGVVAGVVLLAAAPALPASCSTDTIVCSDPKDRNTAKFAYDMPIAGTISLIGGGVLLAGGLIWHFLEPTGPVATTARKLPSVMPTAGPGYGGVTLGGAF